jgi:hypothetical protein
MPEFFENFAIGVGAYDASRLYQFVRAARKVAGIDRFSSRVFAAQRMG